MNRLHNAWRPLLLGLVLLSVLVGVAGAVPTDQPHALSTRRQLVIAAADFYPKSEDADYFNEGTYLISNLDLTEQAFLASVDFPYSLWVTIDKVELFAYDNNSAGNIVANLLLSRPSSGTADTIATIDTGHAFAQPMVNTFQTTAIIPNVKNPANDVYVSLSISDNDALALYGVRIFYYLGK